MGKLLHFKIYWVFKNQLLGQPVVSREVVWYVPGLPTFRYCLVVESLIPSIPIVCIILHDRVGMHSTRTKSKKNVILRKVVWLGLCGNSKCTWVWPRADAAWAAGFIASGPLLQSSCQGRFSPSPQRCLSQRDKLPQATPLKVCPKVPEGLLTTGICP